MKVRKLIERLNEILEREGDLEVACDLWTPGDVESSFAGSTLAEQEAVLDEMQRTYSADSGMSWALVEDVGVRMGLKPSDDDDQS